MAAQITSGSEGNDFVLVGTVKQTGYEDGSLKIQSLSDNPDRFMPGNTIVIEFFKNYKQFVIATSESDGDNLFISFTGYDDIESSEIFSGKRLFIRESELQQLSETEWYLHELLQCTAWQGEVRVGVVTEVYSGDVHDILAVQTVEGGEILLPTVPEIILRLNREEKRLELNPEIQLYDDED